MSPPKLRVGFLGCGTITRTQHLPAATIHPAVEVSALVDADQSRAGELASRFGLQCVISGDYRATLSHVDAVVNALPNALHSATTLELLRAGKHVLCEKPLAITSANARSITALAAEKGLILAVGMNRRFEPSHHLLRCVLRDQQLLGRVTSYDWQYGSVFDWHSASAFYFSREMAGGGVLIDFGVHLLDSVIDWFGPVSDVEYHDDDWGSGVEANCILKLHHEAPSGRIQGCLQLSRTLTLRNCLRVEGTNAAAEIRVGETDRIFLRRVVGGERVSDALSLETDSGKSSFYRQLDNFVQSIQNSRPPEVDGTQAVRVLELIERCYNHRRRLPEPWSELELARSGAKA